MYSGRRSQLSVAEPASSRTNASKTPRRRIVAAIHHRQPKSHLGELYTTVTDFLVATGKWKLKTKPIWPFDVCLGESIGQGIPYSAMARNPSCLTAPPLVNFYEKFKPLTWKADMVLTLERFCRRNGLDLTTIIPDSFVFYAGQDNKTQLLAFEKAFRQSKRHGRGVWILKPSHGGKGNSIELVRQWVVSGMEGPESLTTVAAVHLCFAASLNRWIPLRRCGT